MNKASGHIHKKLWVSQEGGIAKLREDDFGVKIDCLGAAGIILQATTRTLSCSKYYLFSMYQQIQYA